MPTTDPRIAIAVLASLEAAEVSFALLQSPDALLTRDSTGDIDIVISSPPDVALEKAAGELEARGVRPAAFWRYDVGGTATVFFFDPTGAMGAQVDMLYDPKGLGQYSIRSRALLDSSEPAEPFPIIAPLELAIYLFSKRSRKRQLAKLSGVKAQIDTEPETDVQDAVRHLVTSNRLAKQITDRSLSIGPRLPSFLSRSARLMDRLAHPVGFWAHCPGPREDLATALADQFGAVLIHSRASHLPQSAFHAWHWYWRTAQPIRLRPGILVSWGTSPHGFRPSPDFTVDRNREMREASRDIIAAMSSRLNGFKG